MSHPSNSANKHDPPGSTSQEQWLFYDGSCGFCLDIVQKLTPHLQHAHFKTAALQTDWVREQLGNPSNEDLLKEMRVLTATGQLYGGADAVLYLAKCLWWGYPLYLLGFFPGFKPLLHKIYQQIATRRHCSAHGCQLPPSSRNHLQ